MQAAADELGEVGAEPQAALLEVLKEPHHPRGLLVENERRLGKEHPVAADKAVEGFGLRHLGLAQKAEQAAAFRHRRGGDREPLAEQLGDGENAARVLKVVAHEGLAAAQDVFLRIVQLVGDLHLLAHHDHVGGALVQVVQLGADAEEKVVGAVELAALGFVDEFFLHEPGGGLHALLEKADPQKVLVVAQAAAAVLDVRLLHIDGAPEFLVALRLVGHALGDVFVHMAGHAFRHKGGAELREKPRVPGDETRLEQCGFREHVAVGMLHRVGDGAGGVADFEAHVPQHVEDDLDDFAEPRVGPLRRVRVEKHDVHIAERIQLAAPVAADGYEGERRQLARRGHGFQRGVEQVPEDDIHEAGALRANLASAAAGVVPQPDAVVLDLEEFFVKREPLGGVQRALRAELLLGVGEDFFTMAKHEWERGRCTMRGAVRLKRVTGCEGGESAFFHPVIPASTGTRLATQTAQCPPVRCPHSSPPFAACAGGWLGRSVFRAGTSGRRCSAWG